MSRILECAPASNKGNNQALSQEVLNVLLWWYPSRAMEKIVLSISVCNYGWLIALCMAAYRSSSPSLSFSSSSSSSSAGRGRRWRRLFHLANYPLQRRHTFNARSVRRLFTPTLKACLEFSFWICKYRHFFCHIKPLLLAQLGSFLHPRWRDVWIFLFFKCGSIVIFSAIP